jgi:hypothetical protein
MQGSFQQSLVEIGSVVSEENICFDFDRLFKLEKGGMKLRKIISSETAEPISTKLC